MFDIDNIPIVDPAIIEQARNEIFTKNECAAITARIEGRTLTHAERSALQRALERMVAFHAVTSIDIELMKLGNEFIKRVRKE